MNKETRKKDGTVKTGVLSLLIAVVLWVVIGVVQNPDLQGTVTNIPIEYTNIESLAANSLVVVPAVKTDITARISGKRGDVMEASGNVKCVVDVSGIKESGDYTLEGTVVAMSSRISIERGRSANVSVHVEELVTKEFDVGIRQTGSSKNNLIRSVPGTDKVSISGAQSEINAIAAVNAEVNISDITQSGEKMAMLVPVTEDGAPISGDRTVSMEVSRTVVTNTVYAKKTLPIKLRLTSKLENEYWLDEKSSTISESSVEVGLLPDSTADCVYLNINSAQSDEGTYQLIEEEGMYIPESSKEVEAKVSLVKKLPRHTDVYISAKNIGDGLSTQMPEKVTGVLVYAPLEVLNSSEIKGTVDLEGKTAGSYRLKVELEDERVSSDEDIYVDVIIS